MKKVGIVSLMLMLTAGCVVVGGYSSGRGWFLWPGTIIFLVLAIMFMFFRRRG